MATPLLTSMFKPTDFDLFLDEIGLEDLTGRSRVELIDDILQSVEYALSIKIFRRLSTEKQAQLNNLMDEADKTGNEAIVNDFLAQEFPDIESVVDEAIEKVKNDLRLSTASMKDSIARQVAEFQHNARAGEDTPLNEQFNATDLKEQFNLEEPDTVPVPEPVAKPDKPEEPDVAPAPAATNTDAELAAIRERLQQTTAPSQPVDDDSSGSNDTGIADELNAVPKRYQ